jgi:chromosome segregation ATPase
MTPQPNQNIQAMVEQAHLPDRYSLKSFIAGLKEARLDIAQTEKTYTEGIRKKDEELARLQQAVSFQTYRGDHYKSVVMRVLNGKKELKERISDLEQEVSDLKDNNAECKAELEHLREDLFTGTKVELKTVKAELEKMQRKYSELEGTFAAVKGVVSNHERKRTWRSDDDDDDDDEDEDIRSLKRRCRIF